MKQRIFFLILLSLGGVFSTFSQSGCDFAIARLHYEGGGDWYSNPSSLPNLIAAAQNRLEIDICDTVKNVKISDEDLYQYPFLYATGHGNIKFSDEDRLRLRQYLIKGGFLWADDNYGMDKSFRREMALLFPDHKLVKIPLSHPIYHSKYRMKSLPKIHKHEGKPAEGLGIFFENRLVVFYTYSSDIGDGMENIEVHNDGPELHELALRMGVNVLSYFFNPVPFQRK